jgi:hypothetical protein
MTAEDGRIDVRFHVPEDERLRMDELATFALHLDVIKRRLTKLTDEAIANTEGYALIDDQTA